MWMMFIVDFLLQQVLIKAIRKYCHRYHLLELLTKVNKRVVDKQSGGPNRMKSVQVPHLTHTLRAKVYLGSTPTPLQVAVPVPGYVSFRLPDSGTFFIQTLVEVIRKYHHRHHFLEILTEVTKLVVERQNKMEHPVQVPAPVHTLTNLLYL
ncbi:hypothetical protein ACROYT_G024501 [Oculina patagonica]